MATLFATENVERSVSVLDDSTAADDAAVARAHLELQHTSIFQAKNKFDATLPRVIRIERASEDRCHGSFDRPLGERGLASIHADVVSNVAEFSGVVGDHAYAIKLFQ